MARLVLRHVGCHYRNFSTKLVERSKTTLGNHSPTLSDKHGRFHNYLRISLTERCNLRCTYCMPEEGVELTRPSHLLTNEEVIRITKIFAEEGVDKIRLTGGEPLLRKDIVDVCKNISDIPGIKTIGITTNGITGKRHFPKLRHVGLTHVNISLDTLIPQKFEFITRRNGWSKVMESINQALKLDFHSVKLNCVVMRGLNEDEILSFVDLTKDKALDVRFIEYMPFDGNRWNTAKFYPFQEMLKKIKQAHPTVFKLNDLENDTSKAYKISGYKGQLGFITSMSQNFCSTCNRLRLTADGNLKVCLFGPNEISLRDAIRSGASDDELRQVVSLAVDSKKKRHAVHRNQHNSESHFGFPSLVVLRSSSFRSSPSSRMFSTDMRYTAQKFTHISNDGKLNMVNVSGKATSVRAAKASALVELNREIVKLIKENTIKKGDVITVAKIAGIMAAKNTDKLIPLCHGIALHSVKVDIEVVNGSSLRLLATAVAADKTGVEMEALTAVTVSALTIYDMCKALSHDIVIRNVQLEEKTGGKSDFMRKRLLMRIE